MIVQIRLDKSPIPYQTSKAFTFGTNQEKEKSVVREIESQCIQHPILLPSYVQYRAYVIPVVKDKLIRTDTGIGYPINTEITAPVDWTYRSIEEHITLSKRPILRALALDTRTLWTIFIAECNIKKKLKEAEVANDYYNMDVPSKVYIDGFTGKDKWLPFFN